MSRKLAPEKAAVPGPRQGAFTPSIPESAALSLGRLVGKAMADFKAGKDPDRCFREYDIVPFSLLLSLEPSAAADALFSFMDRSGEERMAACMFVSTAILALNGEEPLAARRCIGSICHKASGDPSFAALSSLVLLSIADVADRIGDQSAASIGLCCTRALKNLAYE